MNLCACGLRRAEVSPAVPFFRTGSLLQSDAKADFKGRDVEGLDWLLGTVGTPAPELVEPPCAQIVRMNPENRLGKAGRV
jgi:hypothetical protein